MPSILNCFKTSNSNPEKLDKSNATSSTSTPSSKLTTSKKPPPYSTETSFCEFHRGYHYPCKPSNTPVDIVAVHGTTGDVNTTWERGYPSSDSNWLTYPLSYQMPGTRMFGFGYDARVFWAEGEERLDVVARGLLEKILGERSWGEQDRKRPIIFVCHSLGGILVKRVRL
jgi:hypothetical protein